MCAVKVLVVVLFDLLEVDGLEGEGEHLIAVVLVELAGVGGCILRGWRGERLLLAILEEPDAV